MRLRPLLLALLAPALGCVVRTSVTTAPSPSEAPSAAALAAPPSAPTSTAAPAPVTPAPAPEDPRAPNLDARRFFVAALQRPPVRVTPVERVPRVVLAGLEGTARGAAAGMTAQGEPTVAVLAEGARLAVPLPLQPGECHVIVAQGGLGVVELDLHYTGGTALDILAEDRESGPVAVLRGEADCLEASARGPVSDGVLHATLRRGAGLVALQIYKR